MALIGARLGIEHDHAAIGIAIRSKHFLGRHIDRNVGRRAESLGRIRVVALALLADLEDELAVHGELEKLTILLAVAGQPNEIIVVDEDAVLALGPLVVPRGTAPTANHITGLVEDENWRSGDAAVGCRGVLLGGTLARSERARTVHDPDAVVFVGGNARDLPEDPIVRQRLRPERVGLKLRQRVLGRCWAREKHHRGAEAHVLRFHVDLTNSCRRFASDVGRRVARMRGRSAGSPSWWDRMPGWSSVPGARSWRRGGDDRFLRCVSIVAHRAYSRWQP